MLCLCIAEAILDMFVSKLKVIIKERVMSSYIGCPAMTVY